MIVYCAADLLWATRIRAAADAAGVPARPVRSPDMLDARLADSDVRTLIVDLEAGPVALELVRRLRGPDAGARLRAVHVVAFGPHVDRAGLDAARQAGADMVLPRGAFDALLPRSVRAWATGGGAESA